MTTPTTLKVIGLGGSLAPHSTSLAALKIALEGAVEAGVETQLFDIRLMGLPMYVPGTKDIPEQAAELCEAVFNAQGMIWSSPLYHGTVSGSFKNALDWLNLLAKREPPYLTDKIIGLVSTAGGVHGLQAINTMEFAARALRAWTVPLVMPIPRAWETFDDQGHTHNPAVENQLHTLGREVARASHQFSQEGMCDYSIPFRDVTT